MDKDIFEFLFIQDIKNMSVADRIALAIEQSGYTKAKIARAIGVTPQSVQKWVKKGSISKDHEMAFAKLVGKTIEWIRYGEIVDDYDSSKALIKASYIGPPAKHIPLISWEYAAQILSSNNNPQKLEKPEIIEWIPSPGDLPDECFALEHTGDSMHSNNPFDGYSFPSGTKIFVTPSHNIQTGDYVIATLDDKELLFRKYIIDNGMPTLKPLNSQWPFPSKEQIIRIKAKVVNALIDVST